MRGLRSVWKKVRAQHSWICEKRAAGGNAERGRTEKKTLGIEVK